MQEAEKKQAEFMLMAQQINGKSLAAIVAEENPDEVAVLYANLISEEHEEFQEAFTSYLNATDEAVRFSAIVDISDALADMLVVMLGVANALDIPLTDCYNEVHRSNMLKGTPVRTDKGLEMRLIKNAEGKVLKPEGWNKPRLKEILQQRMFFANAGN